jgi:hypothetical protein
MASAARRRAVSRSDKKEVAGQWKAYVVAVQNFEGGQTSGCRHGGIKSELDGVKMFIPCFVSAVQAAAHGVDDGTNGAFTEPVRLRVVRT